MAEGPYDVPQIAGTYEQEREYYIRRILERFPNRSTDPALLYGDPKLEYLRLKNEGLIPDPEDTTAEVSQLKSEVGSLDTLVGTLNLFMTTGKSFIATDPRFGVKGDGTTDDTAAMQRLFDHIKGLNGGTLIFPPGTSYHLKNSVKICSNITVVALGATFLKREVATYSFFAGLHQQPNTLGYGAGPSNVKWTGGTFKGDFSKNVNGCPFALHHSQNWEVDGVNFDEVQSGGHTFDLAGCDNITIRRCVWRGFNVTASGTAKNTECIQLDISGPNSPSVAEPVLTNYDRLFTRNVTVENCQFLPLDLNGVHHPCPNPMGSHAAHEDSYAENIKFIGNRVVDLTEDTNSTARGGLHFKGVKNITIKDNTFTQNVFKKVRAIAFYMETVGRKVSWDMHTLPYGPTEVLDRPLPVSNVFIENNVFTGFQSDTSDNETIYCSGAAIDYAKNIHIHNNTFDNPAPLSAAAKGAAISTIYTKKLYVTKNTFENIVAAFYCVISQELSVESNTITNCSGYPVYVGTSKDIGVNGNIINVTFLQGIFMYLSVNVGIHNNQITEPQIIATGNNDCIRIRDTTVFSISGNNLMTTKTTGNERGMAIYGTSGQGLVSDNIAKGYGTIANIASATGGNIKITDTNLVIA